MSTATKSRSSGDVLSTKEKFLQMTAALELWHDSFRAWVTHIAELVSEAGVVSADFNAYSERGILLAEWVLNVFREDSSSEQIILRKQRIADLCSISDSQWHFLISCVTVQSQWDLIGSGIMFNEGSKLRDLLVYGIPIRAVMVSLQKEISINIPLSWFVVSSIMVGDVYLPLALYAAQRYNTCRIVCEKRRIEMKYIMSFLVPFQLTM